VSSLPALEKVPSKLDRSVAGTLPWSLTGLAYTLPVAGEVWTVIAELMLLNHCIEW
jgi:hypothetical protein